MLAPLDAKAVVEVGDEQVVLRLNFRSIALAEKHGIKLLSGETPQLGESDGIVLVKCLAVEEQPDFHEGHIMTMVAQNPQGVQKALIDLFAEFGSKVQEGNAKRRKAST